MNKIFTITMLSVSSFTAMSQTAPVIKWQKSYGGLQGETAKSLQRTADGGFVIAGVTNSRDMKGYHGRADVYVAKTDTGGSLVWQRTLGGTQDDEANAVATTSDGGFIVAGYTKSNDGDVTYNHLLSDCWVIKLNSAGETEWQKTYGGKANDEANAIIQTTDGGYMIAGYTASEEGDPGVLKRNGTDCWMIKINSTGNIEWQKTFNGKSNETINSIRQTHDGGFIFAALVHLAGFDIAESKGEDDFWIVKTSSRGEIQWQKTYGGRGNDMPYDIQLTSDGGYIAAGTTYSQDGDVQNRRGQWNDYWLIKMNAAGGLEWQKSFGGSRSDIAYSVKEAKDGYLVAGLVGSGDGDVTGMKGDVDAWVVKTDKNGNLQWQKALGGSYGDRAYAVVVCPDGAIMVAGNTNSNNGDIVSRVGTLDALLIKLK